MPRKHQYFQTKHISEQGVLSGTKRDTWYWQMCMYLITKLQVHVDNIQRNRRKTAACQASLSITSSWSLLKLMSIKSMMPSNHLIPSPLAFNLFQHQGLFQWVSSLHQVSSLVIAFLPRSKRLLISWLQSPSAMILEPLKIKSVTVSTVSSSICHEVMGPNAMIFVFWLLMNIEHSLALPFFGIGMKTDLFQSCGHGCVFQICWHIECSTFTASSFRIWNSEPWTSRCSSWF